MVIAMNVFSVFPIYTFKINALFTSNQSVG